ncbi:MAG: hypothetical protein HY922_03330 [Elusimicrobia bacterium]|nr:hypothetical protein [Elusimicrobiota bacterium]
MSEVESKVKQQDPTYLFWTPNEHTCNKAYNDDPNSGMWCIRTGTELQRLEKWLDNKGLSGWASYPVTARSSYRLSYSRAGLHWRVTDDKQVTSQEEIAAVLMDIFGPKESPNIYVERIAHQDGSLFPQEQIKTWKQTHNYPKP